jgi:AcrR family transcriptional regulator
MSVTESHAPPGPRMPLRERKKQATRRTLRRVALELITQRGFSQVTVEDIAEAADVSPRTFFNYFPSKEAALFGADPARIAALRDGLVHQLPGAPALDVLRVVLAEDARAVAEELTALGGDPAMWLRRVREARADPHLRAAQAAQMAMVERAIADALAERLGTDADRDPYPALLAAAATGALRVCTTFWASAGGTIPLDHLTDMAFRALADGLPENCAVRQVTATAVPRKDNDQ